MWFLGEIEEILDVVDPQQFVRIQKPLFQQLSRCVSSPQFQVLSCYYYYYNKQYKLIYKHCKHYTIKLTINVYTLTHY